MVDVSDKPVSRRTAVAEGYIHMARSTLQAIESGEVEKGEALAVARLAAIGAAKRASDWIPLCHPIPLDRIDVEIEAQPELPDQHTRPLEPPGPLDLVERPAAPAAESGGT